MPKITKSVVDTAVAPEKGDTWIWDTDLQGFGVRVQAGGRKTYVVRYRTKDANRVQRKLTLCRVSDAPPDKARQMARDIFLSVAAGNDPAEERKPAKATTTITLEAMFEGYVAHMRSENRASADEVERVLLKAAHNAADSLGRHDHPATVTATKIVDFVAPHFEKGHRGAADKARTYVSAAFSWAITSTNDYTVKHRKDWGVKHNPAADVKKDAEAVKTRDRNLDAAEIKLLWESCQGGSAGFSEGVEVLLRMIIGCGQRVVENLRIEGREVDLDAGIWHMPAHKTKLKKRDHIIPLSRHVIPDLRRLKDKYGDGHLFPGRSDSDEETLGITAISHAVSRWVRSKDKPMAPFQPRDLRRTWKSRSHDAGISREMRDIIQHP